MGTTAVRKLSRLHKPPDMSLEAWQRELRRQFGREQSFTLKNHGTEPVFSEFQVTNPRSGSTYRVAIRGSRPGDNYCSCHVLFHGGVDGSRRKALVDRFREHDRCRAFLATDAGGVGLNLQHASIVVNMDLPWNPAVLEQRIGRVHRLGQRNPVRVVNFIAEGTIEEGMLSVLTFKKSLFAGVLDGGEREVFLGGSRLSRFMDAVEKTTTAIAPPRGVSVSGDHLREVEPDIESEPRADAPVTAPSAPAAGDWAALMQTGLAWLEQVAAVSAASRDGRADGLRFVHRDPQTGEDYVRLPVPSPEVLDGALRTIGRLLDRFRP